MSRIDNWNERHRRGDGGGKEPAPIVVEAANFREPSAEGSGQIALDLACGSGRNAIYLRDRGWNVVAVDASIEAVRMISAQPRSAAPHITAALADLERDILPFRSESFDLAINVLFLHRPLFSEIRRVLKPGGLFAAQIHIRGINPEFCVAPGELRTRFEDWTILQYRENETSELIARKPAS